jgi:2-keto-4-pentenoate hydratase/2-oxohepta-3-ene-1,7-dioic acid hydratase in catechol pathway
MNNIFFDTDMVLHPTKIIGVGLNYADHIDEMKSKKPSEPVLFIKPTTSLCRFNDPISLPKNRGSVHYELELAVCIKKEAINIVKDKAAEYIAGFGMALDLTLRDVQSAAKSKGRPWAVAKGFDNSCPITTFFNKSIEEVQNNQLQLSINGEIRQDESTALMLFKIDELISYISSIFTLLPGDIILTGTPAGVGALSSGDKIKASIERLVSMETNIL